MHLLQAQQGPALPYAKVVGRPGTGSYPAPLPDPTTHSYIGKWVWSVNIYKQTVSIWSWEVCSPIVLSRGILCETTTTWQVIVKPFRIHYCMVLQLIFFHNRICFASMPLVRTNGADLSIYVYCLNPVKRTFGQVRRGITPRKKIE